MWVDRLSICFCIKFDIIEFIAAERRLARLLNNPRTISYKYFAFASTLSRSNIDISRSSITQTRATLSVHSEITSQGYGDYLLRRGKTNTAFS